jgi:tripartite ATP-independent transporter DctM subunit
MLLTLCLTFVVLLLIGMPISFCLGIAALVTMFLADLPLFLIVRKMYAGLDYFVLLAVPLFILAAEIMSASGITDRLIRFADLIIGRIRGGMGHTNVLASMFFAGISGAAIADASGLGAVEIKMMRSAGYDKRFSAAVTAASAIIGPIIPPSIMMIIYAVVAGNVSIIGLFAAGIVPGALLGVVLMGLVYFLSVRHNYPRRERRIPFREGVATIANGTVAVIMPLIIVGGILFGVFTPTEAAAVAVLYAFVVGLVITRELDLRVIPGVLQRSFVTTAVVFLIIAAAAPVAYILTLARAPEAVAAFINAVADNPILFLLLLNAFFLILGSIMEPGAAMIISVPIFVPIAGDFGIDPLHFAIIVIVNLSIGCITPPIGTSLYAVAAVAKMPVEHLIRAIVPFILVEIGLLLIITFVPSLSLTLPRLLGLHI